ncbi:hypothetical protein SprV_0501796200 [Sparganum proliferum]
MIRASTLPVALLLFQLYGDPDCGVPSGFGRDSRALSPPAEDTKNWTGYSLLVLLEICTPFKSDLDSSTSELVSGVTV